MHKISDADTKLVESMLHNCYSDNVMCPVYLSMVEQKNKHLTFSHPPDWDKLSDLQKAHLMVKTLFLKLLAIVNFSDMSFKEMSSLNSNKESFLNKDTRLEHNKPKPPQFVKEVKDEIWKSRTTIHLSK